MLPLLPATPAMIAMSNDFAAPSPATPHVLLGSYPSVFSNACWMPGGRFCTLDCARRQFGRQRLHTRQLLATLPTWTPSYCAYGAREWIRRYFWEFESFESIFFIPDMSQTYISRELNRELLNR
jgi:hypothetical protein